MNKMLIALAAAFLAVTAMFGSSAQAGFNVRLGVPAGFSQVHAAGCGGGYFRSYRRRAHHTARRSVKPTIHVARKHAAETVNVAKVEDKPETTTSAVADTENSSISVTDGKVAEAVTPEPEKKVAVAKDLGCKKFFPSVGMTLTVPCE